MNTLVRHNRHNPDITIEFHRYIGEYCIQVCDNSRGGIPDVHAELRIEDGYETLGDKALNLLELAKDPVWLTNNWRRYWNATPVGYVRLNKTKAEFKQSLDIVRRMGYCQSDYDAHNDLGDVRLDAAYVARLRKKGRL